MIATIDTERPQHPIAPIIQPANIPQKLTQLRQWVMWKYIFDGKKWTKVPYQPDGAKASTTDPATWTDYKTVLATRERQVFGSKSFDGIGFVLSADDPFCGVDLDHCLKDGVLTEWAKRVVAALNSYTEITPSGEGLRIFVRGKLPGGDGRKNDKIEIYDRARFLTITGQVFKA